MKRYESFSPAIPDIQDISGTEELPPFMDFESNEKPKKEVKKKIPKRLLKSIAFKVMNLL